MAEQLAGCCCEICCQCCAGCCISQDPNNNCFTCCFQLSCGICINVWTCMRESCDITNCFLCLYIGSTYHYLYNNKYESPTQIVIIKDDNVFKINTVCIIEVQNNKI